MPTTERFLNNAANEPAHGTVGACTAEDLPTLAGFCGADFIAEYFIRDAAPWRVYRDGNGTIRVAVFVQDKTVMWLFARPEECESAEIKRGFLLLAQHIHSELMSKFGVSDITVAYGPRLHRLARLLEREGFLSREVIVTRVLSFSESGAIMRVS